MIAKDLRHTCECTCAHCEGRRQGITAQRDALAGDPTAAQRLSPAVFAFLTAERQARRLRRASKVAA